MSRQAGRVGWGKEGGRPLSEGVAAAQLQLPVSLWGCKSHVAKLQPCPIFKEKLEIQILSKNLLTLKGWQPV